MKLYRAFFWVVSGTVIALTMSTWFSYSNHIPFLAFTSFLLISWLEYNSRVQVE